MVPLISTQILWQTGLNIRIEADCRDLALCWPGCLLLADDPSMSWSSSDLEAHNIVKFFSSASGRERNAALIMPLASVS